VIYPLDGLAPVHSLAVIYLLVVLPVASVWGLPLGLASAVASALAFNAFHLSDKSPLDIDDAENLVALAVFLLASLLASRADADSGGGRPS
jgi:two-component system, OmpR family, sensor histidine kinase KdpD